jgi:hypothetical protein
MKRDLLIITCGPNALFQDWGSYKDYNFDVALIRWGNHELKNIDDAAHRIDITGHKWQIISKFNDYCNLSDYEYIYCLDDDCVTNWDLVQATFDFCRDNNLDLAQPALAPGSYASHAFTHMIEGAKMHIMNTVEIMCPIFKQCVWAECIKPAKDMPVGIGYGYEGYWAKVLESQTGTTKYGGQVAVIDCLPVLHSKPVTQMHEWHARGLDPAVDGKWFDAQGYAWSFDQIEIINE